MSPPERFPEGFGEPQGGAPIDPEGFGEPPDRGRLAALLEAGAFVVTGELVPPRSSDPEMVRRAARPLRGTVDAVNVTDNATARVGMSPIAAAALLVGQGLDPIVQLTCRDRNRLALAADLLGAHALGVRAVLCLSGDPMDVGPHGHAKAVFDLDAVGLMQLASELGAGRGLDGDPIRSPAPLLIGAAEAPGVDPTKGARLAAKVAAGARFVQTQPIFDVGTFAAWLDAVGERGLLDRVAVLAGVLPPRSAAQLDRLAALPGWAVPESAMARMAAAHDQAAEGVKLAAEVVDQVRGLPGVRGVHVMGIGTTGIPEVVELAGLLPRPPPG